MPPRHPAAARTAGLLAAALLGGLAAFLGCRMPPPPAPGSLNLILICIDTVRFDSFWSLGGPEDPDALSPWIPRALRFQRAQSPAPWTTPAVASVMTGLYPPQHGAGRFREEVADLDEMVPSALTAGVPTVAQLLSRRGYATRAIVAHPWFAPKFGLPEGFQKLLYRTRRRRIARLGQEWIAERRAAEPDRPFLLYLHWMEAHERHRIPGEEVEEALGKLEPRVRRAALRSSPGALCADPRGIHCRRYQLYLGAVSRHRAVLADLLEFLEGSDLLAETAVVAFSDHGEEFFDHLAFAAGRDADPRGYDGIGHGHSLFQEVLHVPLLVWHPRHPGREVHAPASLVDLAPSLLRWTRTEAPAGWPGIALDRLLDPGGEGGPEGGRTRPLFSSGMSYGPPGFAVLVHPWKRIALEGPPERLLFHLEEDPREGRPLEIPEVARELDSLIARYRELEGPPPADSPTLHRRELERLQALGYLGGLTAED